MQKSLKEVLLEATQRIAPGQLTVGNVEAIAHMQGRKVSYAERELRHLMAEGRVAPNRNEKGAIIGYRYVDVVKEERLEEAKRNLQEMKQEALFSMKARYY